MEKKGESWMEGMEINGENWKEGMDRRERKKAFGWDRWGWVGWLMWADKKKQTPGN